MRNLFASAIILAGATFATASFAEDQMVNGVVKTFDEQTRVVLLEDGNSFKLAKKASAENVKVGEDVVLTVRTNKKGTKVARKVELAN